jgi:hypothetical protein
VRATVPPQARTFTILSEKAKLVDRETELGVEVAASGTTEVHVFAGKVELYPMTSDQTEDPSQEVVAGHGIKVEEGGRRTSIVADTQHFASPDEVGRLAERAAAVRQQQWLQGSGQLRRDPRLLLYFPFQSERPAERVLVAENAPDGSRNGLIVGCEWVGGRWPGKQALEFARPGDRVRVNVPGEFDALTLMAWVRVDALEHRYNALMLTDGYDYGKPHWQITDTGRVRLGICHGTSGPSWVGYNYDTDEIFRPDQFGQWKHLATVYDGPAGEVTHYLNGQPVARRPIKEKVRLNIGNAELGNWCARPGDPTPTRGFNGRIDEFCLVGLALTAEEVSALFRAGEPIR